MRRHLADRLGNLAQDSPDGMPLPLIETATARVAPIVDLAARQLGAADRERAADLAL
jgi:hypothetical protein